MLAGALAASAPDVTSAGEHRRRKDLVRRRLLGDDPPAVRIGRFVLLGQIGSGAMSVVYAAHDAALDRRVAVKLLRTPLASDERLRREAQAMARLSHPNVVAIHEIGHWEGRLFIAMELVEGQPLDAWLAGRRTWMEIAEVFLQAGRGLAAAHDLGLIHRDFKPANVMVGRDGRARVLDFGLVRRAARPDEDPVDPARPALWPISSKLLTAAGACVGTPAYMAPEQCAAMAPDARSDQYSFCAALHEALSGALPGAPPARCPPRRGGPLPARLSQLIGRGLAVDPLARWPSMHHLLGELDALCCPARRWRRRAAALALVAATAVAAAATLAAGHLLPW